MHSKNEGALTHLEANLVACLPSFLNLHQISLLPAEHSSTQALPYECLVASMCTGPAASPCGPHASMREQRFALFSHEQARENTHTKRARLVGSHLHRAPPR
jgi:hypothetical protein